MINTSIIIQEHLEGREFVQKMLDQVKNIPLSKEVIYVTSMSINDFNKAYGPFNYKFPVSIIGNVQSCGEARNAGGKMALGENLLYMDSHVCFNYDNIKQLFTTLEKHPNAIVAPSIIPIDSPSCESSAGGEGQGVAFYFEKTPFEWRWIPSPSSTDEFKSPFVCGCAFSMKKQTFNVLTSYGGFLGAHVGLSWEEEKSMRLWRLGYPTISEPRAKFGHYFKSHPGHKTWDEHSTRGYYLSRVIGIYINVFDPILYSEIETMLKDAWGNEYIKAMEFAKTNYTWLRNLMKPYAKNIDERWFLRNK